MFTANTDSNSIVYNDLASSNGEPLMAKYIRVLPVEFRGNICMRVELYECVGKITILPQKWGFLFFSFVVAAADHVRRNCRL